MAIERTDSVITVKVTPIIALQGTKLKAVTPNTYIIAIPEIVTPGPYHIFLKVLDAQVRRFVYQTDCIVEVEEHQDVERLSNYMRIAPSASNKAMRNALTMEREVSRNLCVIFLRDSIREQMGPQFVTIRTTVISREGGFTIPLMLDVFEVLRILNLEFFKKLNGGLELTPFFPIKKKFRLLLDAQISFSL